MTSVVAGIAPLDFDFESEFVAVTTYHRVNVRTRIASGKTGRELLERTRLQLAENKSLWEIRFNFTVFKPNRCNWRPTPLRTEDPSR